MRLAGPLRQAGNKGLECGLGRAGPWAESFSRLAWVGGSSTQPRPAPPSNRSWTPPTPPPPPPFWPAHIPPFSSHPVAGKAGGGPLGLSFHAHFQGCSSHGDTEKTLLLALPWGSGLPGLGSAFRGHLLSQYLAPFTPEVHPDSALPAKTLWERGPLTPQAST